MARPSTSSSTSSRSSAQAPSTSQTETNRRRSGDTPEKDSSEHKHDYADIQSPFTSKPYPYDVSLLPEGKRSLSHISAQAFWLGFVLAASLILGIQAASYEYRIWRLFAFTASLSLFHFLEFWTTATYNLPQVRASSFLLFSNGTAYNTAHGAALLEILFSTFLFPSYQARFVNFFTIFAGLILVIFGQLMRSIAMATAGTNFNHTPQRVKQQGHELVTSGIYALSRHPSYMAFFWWAIGTQILVGNKICLVAFIISLWTFFNNRIKCELSSASKNSFSYRLHSILTSDLAEERSLVEFFGRDYHAYRKSTMTGIPFI
jgi:protein-S-isoprenylcysteine O-methyltransferase